MKPLHLSILLAFTLGQTIHAQNFSKLNTLGNRSFEVYYSSGFEQRATDISSHVDRAMTFQSQLLGFKPTIILLVLSKTDWSTYTNFPVYGMPHYNDDKTLVVAAENNPFWQSFLPPLNNLSPALQKEVQHAYGTKGGEPSMQPFFDLLAIHELGHAFHLQYELTMQRKWMGELFCNIFLHTYVAENEPGLLPALTVFPKMVVANGTSEFKYTSLQDVHERYEEIGTQHPKNYGWYQCKWHMAAATIYDQGGKAVSERLWVSLKNKKEVLPDSDLVNFLETIHPSVADVMRNWEK